MVVSSSERVAFRAFLIESLECCKDQLWPRECSSLRRVPYDVTILVMCATSSCKW